MEERGYGEVEKRRTEKRKLVKRERLKKISLKSQKKTKKER
jgi:hypothetical protein